MPEPTSQVHRIISASTEDMKTLNWFTKVGFVMPKYTAGKLKEALILVFTCFFCSLLQLIRICSHEEGKINYYNFVRAFSN